MALTMPPRVQRPRRRVHAFPYPSDDDRWRVASYVVVALVLVALTGVTLMVFLGRTTQPDRYEATLLDVTPLDPNTVRVAIRVLNQGPTTAMPTCTVELSSWAGAYTGTASTRPSAAIAPGTWAIYYSDVPVTTNGAIRVGLAKSTASCH
jgi:hypothetical protein